MFAYGQTGSGKTYTMGTALSAKQIASKTEESVIPRTLQLIFEAIASISKEYITHLKVSIYTEHSVYHS